MTCSKFVYNCIFNSFIWKTKLNYDGKTELIDKIQKDYINQPSKTPKHWKCDVHSSDNHIQKDLIELFESKTNEFLDFYEEKMKIKGEYYIDEVWYNAYSKNQFQEPHLHGHSLFSGCYYLKFNKEKHYQTEFYNPNYSLDYNKIGSNLYFRFEPDCLEGDLIIFPSFLKHGTRGVKKDCDEIRITISFNIMNSDICFTNYSKNKIFFDYS